ncbi:MAG: chitobiase/beta-hexosaminidase C-terminal domain-containing protein [Bacteroidaceae bacterium]
MKQFTLKSLMLMLSIILGGVNAVAQSTWTRCTTVEDLLSGGTFIIGYEATAGSGVIVPMQNDGTANTSTAGYLYTGTTSGSATNGTIDMSSVSETSMYEVTISASTVVDGAISIKCPKGFVGNTNTKNNLKFFASESANTSFTPSVGTNDVFTLTITGNETYTTLQYNSSSPRFAVYSNTQKDVVIYKKQVSGTSVETPTFTVSSGTYTSAQIVKVENYSEDYIYAYTTDGTIPVVDGELNVTNGTNYNHTTGIEISISCTLKMVAVDADGNTSSVGSATYTFPVVFASLEELAAADLTTGTLVTVSFTEVPIKDIYVTSAGYRSGVYFDIQKGGNDIEIYFQNVPDDWVKEGKLSGTITGTWKTFNGTWEIVPGDDWSWDELTYVDAPVKTDATLDFEGKSSLFIGETDTYTVTYNGDGALTVESSDPSVATASIEGTIVTITPVAKGKTTITISGPSTENYYAIEKSYDLYVSVPLIPAANGYESVDFTKIEPYCSLSSGGSATVESYDGTSFKMVFAKPQSSTTPTKYYENGTAVRAYTGNTITITAAEEIVAVKVNYVSGYVDGGETITGLGTKEVVITSSKTCRFTSIDVYYKGVILPATDGTANYATFGSDKNVEFVDATVYAVNVEGTALQLTEVTNKQVPAGTGVLIKGSSETAPYFYIDEAATIENNLLKPASEEMAGDYTFYKLAYDDYAAKTGLGFYWGAEDGAVFDVKAGTAYLAVPNTSSVKGFLLDGTPTAIEGVEAESTTGAIYNLSGQRVQKAQRGLYIVNGKKLMVK